jgi:hypothetical protein
MRPSFCLSLVFPLALIAQSAAKSAPASAAKPASAPKAAASAPMAPASAPMEGAAHADVQVGTGVENHAIVGGADHFSIAAGTKLWAWAQLSGMTPDSSVTVVWKREGTEVSRTELNVKSARYRTQAYRTFTPQNGGKWTVSFVGADGAELGSAAFSVEITG